MCVVNVHVFYIHQVKEMSLIRNAILECQMCGEFEISGCFV